MGFAVVRHAHRNIFAVNGRLRAAGYGGADADRNQQTGRDLRLDLFRGLSLFFIFIDHLPNNVLSYFTLQSISFCDAAEVFIFISGFAAATVYGKALQRQGSIVATARIYRRVWQIYAAHIFLFVILAALVGCATLNVENQSYSEDLGIDNLLDEPKVAIIQTLLLRYQPQFLDILPLYVVLLGFFPLVLLLLRRHLALPLALSGAIYLLTLHFGWHPHSYPDDEAWYFNPLAWQFLFVIGATAGYAPYSRQVLPLPGPWLVKVAIGMTITVAVIHISWIIHEAYEAFPGLLVQELLPFVDGKTNLSPLRLVSFLALAVTTAHFVGRNNSLLHSRIARLIIRCGQHSLQVFCLGILLAVLGQILLTSVRDDIAMQLAISVAGIVLMMAIAGFLAWYKANNAKGSDTAVASATNSEGRTMSIAGIAPTGDLAPAIARIERHAIAAGMGPGRMWERTASRDRSVARAENLVVCSESSDSHVVVRQRHRMG
jgi:hypothetical protein